VGIWMLVNGIILFVAPKSGSEDVGEADDD